jgi:hypothetical protein
MPICCGKRLPELRQPHSVYQDVPIGSRHVPGTFAKETPVPPKRYCRGHLCARVGLRHEQQQSRLLAQPSEKSRTLLSLKF